MFTLALQFRRLCSHVVTGEQFIFAKINLVHFAACGFAIPVPIIGVAAAFLARRELPKVVCKMKRCQGFKVGLPLLEIGYHVAAIAAIFPNGDDAHFDRVHLGRHAFASHRRFSYP